MKQTKPKKFVPVSLPEIYQKFPYLAEYYDKPKLVYELPGKTVILTFESKKKSAKYPPCLTLKQKFTVVDKRLDYYTKSVEDIEVDALHTFANKSSNKAVIQMFDRAYLGPYALILLNCGGVDASWVFLRFLEMKQYIPAANLKTIVSDVVDDLYIVHSRGYIHGDIKAQNIVSHDKRWKLIDFGNSENLYADEDRHDFKRKKVPHIIGSTSYLMAPLRFKSYEMAFSDDFYSLLYSIILLSGTTLPWGTVPKKPDDEYKWRTTLTSPLKEKQFDPTVRAKALEIQKWLEKFPTDPCVIQKHKADYAKFKTRLNQLIDIIKKSQNQGRVQATTPKKSSPTKPTPKKPTAKIAKKK